MDKAEERSTPKRTTLVEEGTAFKGTFASDCPIVVKGKIEGDVTGPSLTVSATGIVAGIVKVGVIESEGELSGEFEADVVRLSGRVRDNTVIRAKSLEVKLQPDKGMLQVVFGECAIDVGDMPSKEAIMGEAQRQHAPVAQNERVREAPAKPAEPAIQAQAGTSAASVQVSAPEPSAPEASAQVSPSEVAREPEVNGQASATSEAEPVQPAIIVAPEQEKPERKHGGRSRGHAARQSSMPPPAE